MSSQEADLILQLWNTRKVASLLYLQLFKFILLFLIWKNYTEQGQMHHVYIDISLEYCQHYPEKKLKHCLSSLTTYFPTLAKYATRKHILKNRTAWHFTFLKIYDLQSVWMAYFNIMWFFETCPVIHFHLLTALWSTKRINSSVDSVCRVGCETGRTLGTC